MGLGIVLKRWSKSYAVLLATLLHASPVSAQGQAQGFLVLGVIAYSDAKGGVALIKSSADGKTFAARIGQEVERGVTIRRITREYVYVTFNGKTEKVRVGEQMERESVEPAAPVATLATGGGIERKGNVVRMTSALREHIIKRELSTVLMQAAAVPYYVNGALQGFRLLDIDPGSVYEQAGFTNGDIVTAINGQSLTDVAMAVRMLQSMKNETEAEVTFIRQGTEQTMQLVVQ